MISASSRNRARLAGSSAWRSLDLLQRHLAVQLLVAGDEDLAQAAPGVRPEDAEPRARRGRRRRRRARVAVGSPSGGRPAATWRRLAWRSGSAIAGQVVARRSSELTAARLRLGVAAVLLEVLGDQRLHRARPAGSIERPRSRQDLRRGLALSATQASKAASRASRADEVVLQRQDAEEQVAPGVGPRPARRRPVSGPACSKAAASTAAGLGKPGPRYSLDLRPLAAAAAQLAAPRHQLAPAAPGPRPPRRTRRGSPRFGCRRPASRPRSGRTPRPPAPTASAGPPPSQRGTGLVHHESPPATPRG